MLLSRRVAGRAALAALLALAALSGPAAGRAPLRPRAGHAFGFVPPLDRAPSPPLVTTIPVAYHGGPVMRDVTVHTVFWAPAGFRFDGSPGGGVPGYEPLVQQFLTDVAHDSGPAQPTGNAFSVMSQYGDGAGAGSYRIAYDPAVDSLDDTNPYPAAGAQCPSPAGTATCVTDAQLQQELDRVIGGAAGARGLSNLWIVLLPPDVDTCTTLGECATSAYAGYHSLFHSGRGPTVYAVIPDPLLELTPPPGADPQGNPEAEATIDTVAHETVEAVTDPEGTGWMDPNGFEVGDKCETGPQQGTPLGYAPDGSPYNQLINGHEYLLQGMWSNARGGCVTSSSAVAGAPALNRIELRQFSTRVRGRLAVPRRVLVRVVLVRGGAEVASAHARSRADGSWGPVTLRGSHGAPHAVGDDRDQLLVIYGHGGAGLAPDAIATGDGGNPFTQSGYTGWYDLDSGAAVTSAGGGRSQVLVGPCSQTGVLSLRIGGTPAPSPTDRCGNGPDAAVITVPRVRAGQTVTLTSEDNRGEYFLRPDGTLVTLTVTLGEPDSVGSLHNDQVQFAPGGFPLCTAFLRIRTVRCAGLVPFARYRLVRRGRTLARARAGLGGAVTVPRLKVRGGDVLTLVNGAGRRLTSLHVAHLRVDIVGNQTILAGGSCQPGDYWGRPLARPPISAAVGGPLNSSDTICPPSGRAKGLPVADIAQTDDFSGGQTETQVPLIESMAPIQDETLYGSFVASAQSGLPGPHGSVAAGGTPISLTVTRAGSPRMVVFRARNVDTATGVRVPALASGAYEARWVLHDAAGDTRTVTTRFVDEGQPS